MSVITIFVLMHMAAIIAISLTTVYLEYKVIRLAGVDWIRILIVIQSLFWAIYYSYNILIGHYGLAALGVSRMHVRAGIFISQLILCVKAVRAVRLYEGHN